MKQIRLFLLPIMAIFAVLACAPAKPVLTPPELLSQPEWTMPQRAQRYANAGDIFKAKVEIIMDADGVPQTTEIIESSGNREIDRYVLRNTKKMRFKAGLADGKPVRSKAIVPIEFRVE
ncbi:energy transducer TonB [Cardiobacteriaceae bacterium TAE3-ERU3]|nr:energy transducer TonB [Cardiobacteriaceae bacterium TAE3-ERU3]